MSNCHDQRFLSCQIDRLLNNHKSSVKRLSRSKTCREAGSAGRSSHRSAVPGGGRLSAVPGGRLSRPPRPERAASNGKAVRAWAAWRWRSALCAGRGRHRPTPARPCRAAGDGGRAAWPLGTAGTPKPAHAAAPRTERQRGASGTGGHQRQTRRPVVLFHVEQLYRIPCCRAML